MKQLCCFRDNKFPRGASMTFPREHSENISTVHPLLLSLNHTSERTKQQKIMKSTGRAGGHLVLVLLQPWPTSLNRQPWTMRATKEKTNMQNTWRLWGFTGERSIKLKPLEKTCIVLTVFESYLNDSFLNQTLNHWIIWMDLNMDSDSNLNSRNSIHIIGFDEELSSFQFKSKKSKSTFSGFSVTSV